MIRNIVQTRKLILNKVKVTFQRSYSDWASFDIFGMACTEQDVGITKYLNVNNPGFKGRIKERFSDFNVTEIQLDGKLVTLHKLEGDTKSVGDEAKKDGPPETYIDLEAPLRKLITEDEFNQILKIQSGEIEKIELVVESLSKDERKQVHSICKIFNLSSNTINNTKGEKVIQAVKANKKGQNRGGIVHGERGRSKEEKFLHFSLYKENIGTTELISQLAHSLRTKDKYFSFAGTKDRRGRTLQRVAVSLIKPESLENTVGRLRCEAYIGNYTYHPQGLRMGDLSGNHFEIGIKDVSIEKPSVEDIMMHFKEHGFVNYFGMQRFGTTDIPTHQVGLKILQKDLQGAIDLVLKPRNHQYAEIQEALLQYEVTKDADTAFSGLSYKMKNRIEAKLLNGLRNCHENDKANAFKFLPSSIKTMYGHAYQSYIWNSTVSRRLEEHGTKVLEGDLIGCEKTEGRPSFGRVNVRRINTEELSQYSIYDIYIPLPGHSVTLPENETKEYILNKLKEDGMDLEAFRNKVRDFDLPGGYRKMLTKAQNVSWEMVNHDKISDDIIPSKVNKTDDENIESKLEGAMKSLIVCMSLDTSCYATMALREIMRIQTDISSMKNLEDGTTEEEETETNEDEGANGQAVENGNKNDKNGDNEDSNKRKIDGPYSSDDAKKAKV